MKSIQYTEGQVFGTLTLIRELPRHISKSGRSTRVFEFKCECGSLFSCRMSHVKNGNTTSCGCIQKQKAKESNIIHGLRYNRLYGTWSSMISRCGKGNYRDISVCNEWLDFKVFLYDMEDSYIEGLTLDRIDTYGNYEPSNCRWATKVVQGQNQKKRASKTGATGVYEVESGYLVKIMIEGIRYRLGIYPSIEKAIQVREDFINLNDSSHRRI